MFHIAELAASDPVLSNADYHRHNLDPRGMYDRAMQKARRYLQLVDQHHLGDEEAAMLLGYYLVMFWKL